MNNLAIDLNDTHPASDRRKSRRLTGDFQVDIVVLSGPKSGDEISGSVVDVSKEGVGLKMVAGVPIGTQLSLVLYIEDCDSLCLGNVVWSKEIKDETYYGVKISDWSYLDPVLESQLTKGLSFL